jgi:hypothetical protein
VISLSVALLLHVSGSSIEKAMLADVTFEHFFLNVKVNILFTESDFTTAHPISILHYSAHLAFR